MEAEVQQVRSVVLVRHLVVLGGEPDHGEPIPGKLVGHMEVRAVEFVEILVDIDENAWHHLAGPEKAGQTRGLICRNSVETVALWVLNPEFTAPE